MSAWSPNEVTSADGGWCVLFAFDAQRPVAAELQNKCQSSLL